MHFIVCNNCEARNTVGLLTVEQPTWEGKCHGCDALLVMALVENPTTRERTIRTRNGRFMCTSTAAPAAAQTRLRDGSIIVWD